MIDPIYSNAIIYSSLLTLLSMGLTLTYLTTKVPNFAHATFATFGTYVALTVVSLWKGNIYQNLCLALIAGGAIALAQYLLVFRPLMRRGATVVGLMITTLAIEFILLATLNIYADYLSSVFKIKSRYFLLKSYDISIAGQRGVLIVAPTLTAFTVILLHLVLTRTKFGVAMRAAIEDSSLASVMGINVNLVYAVSWFVSGALAGLSGMLIPLYSVSNPDVGAWWVVSVFAASIVGGLLSLYGAVLGGFLIGFAEIIGTSKLAVELGTWIVPYRVLISLIVIVITLLLVPEGLLGVDWRGVARTVWHKVAGLLQSPTTLFNDVKDEDWRSSLKDYLRLLAVFATLQTVALSVTYTAIISFITRFFPIRLYSYWPPVVGFVYIFMAGLIAIFAGSLFTHFWVHILGGKKEIGRTVKSIAYGSAPFLLLGWIPFLGILLAVWSLLISTKGIRQLHEMPMRKAATANILGATTLLLIPITTLVFL